MDGCLLRFAVFRTFLSNNALPVFKIFLNIIDLILQAILEDFVSEVPERQNECSDKERLSSSFHQRHVEVLKEGRNFVSLLFLFDELALELRIDKVNPLEALFSWL